MDSEIASFVDDCNINLFSIIDLDVVPEFKTRLRELFLLLSKRNDGVKMRQTVLADESFSRLDRETAVLMSEFADIRLPKKSKEGEYNMCKAVEEIKAEGKAEGRAEGREEGIIETLVSLVRDGLISVEEAAKHAGLSTSEFEKYI